MKSSSVVSVCYLKNFLRFCVKQNYPLNQLVCLVSGTDQNGSCQLIWEVCLIHSIDTIQHSWLGIILSQRYYTEVPECKLQGSIFLATVLSYTLCSVIQNPEPLTTISGWSGCYHFYISTLVSCSAVTLPNH